MKRLLLILCSLLCLYTACYGVMMMGFCPTISQCLPHTFAWILMLPLLLIAFWSIRAMAVAMTLVLIAHVVTDAYMNGGLTMDLLWGADMGLDKCLWLAIGLAWAAVIAEKKEINSKAA